MSLTFCEPRPCSMRNNALLISCGVLQLLQMHHVCIEAPVNAQSPRMQRARTAVHSAAGRRESAALLKAASEENPVLVRNLLDQGARVNARDEDGQTVLMKAATYGLGVSDFKDFASQGDVNNRQPLVKVMKLLLDRGAEVNARDHRGQTALMLTAAYAQSPACIRLLLSHGADLTLRSTDGNRALDYALWGRTHSVGELDNHEIIRILKQAELRKRSRSGVHRHGTR